MRYYKTHTRVVRARGAERFAAGLQDLRAREEQSSKADDLQNLPRCVFRTELMTASITRANGPLRRLRTRSKAGHRQRVQTRGRVHAQWQGVMRFILPGAWPPAISRFGSV